MTLVLKKNTDIWGEKKRGWLAGCLSAPEQSEGSAIVLVFVLILFFASFFSFFAAAKLHRQQKPGTI